MEEIKINLKPYEYDREKRVAIKGLFICFLLILGLYSFTVARINAAIHKELRNRLNKIQKDIEYVKGHQIYNTQVLDEIKFVEAVGKAVSLVP